MSLLAVALFVLTYLGMALGRVPGLRIDRTGIALIAAVILVAAGSVPAGEVTNAIHFPTLLLLAGLMIVSARVGAAGIYDAAAAGIARAAGNPKRLLALTIVVGGLLSAILVNDIVVFAMTPLLCSGLAQRQMDPRPFLCGLAAASNAGSAATLIGNPQNIMIGQIGELGFWSYFADAALPSVGALIISYFCIAITWRDALARLPMPSQMAAPALDKRQAGLCFAAIAVLLALYTGPAPREISTLIVAALLIISRTLPTRRLLDEIDAPLLILFASLFVVNDAFSRTGLTGAAVGVLGLLGWLPDDIVTLAPLSLILSNTIGNVPAVLMILEAWPDIPPGTLTGLAILSTLAGNLLLVGSLANLIVAEQAQRAGVTLGFVDHARAGIPITLLSMALASGWLYAIGLMPF